MHDVDEAKYQQDLTACREYAERIDPAGSAVGGAIIGAAAGAVLGAVVGSFLKQPGTGAAFGASVGGIEGGDAGAAGAAQRQINIINNCLNERGYKVLG